MATGLTSPTFTYTAAMQAEDFPEGYPACAFVVYQISAQVGRSFAARFAFPDAPQLVTLGESIAEGQAGSGTSNFPANTVMAQRYNGISGQVLSASAYLGSSASGTMHDAPGHRHRRVRPGDLVADGTGAFLAFALWLRRALRTPPMRARIDRLLLRLPLAGELAMKLDVARFARTLGVLLGNGVPLLTALAIVQGTLTNTVLREAVGRVATGAKEGQGFAQPLERTGRFPKLALHLIGVGEKSGRLEPMLMKVAEIYDREGQLTIERMMTLLVPILTISLGVVIAGIIGAILSAILQSYQLPL